MWARFLRRFCHKLDSTEEVRVNATLQSARYLQGLRRHYNKNTHPRSLQIRDLVLRRIQKTDGRYKLLSPWEGPFIVTKVTGPSTYKLTIEDGKEVSNTWHINHLRRFYAWKQLKEEYIYKQQAYQCPWSIKMVFLDNICLIVTFPRLFSLSISMLVINKDDVLRQHMSFYGFPPVVFNKYTDREQKSWKDAWARRWG